MHFILINTQILAVAACMDTKVSLFMLCNTVTSEISKLFKCVIKLNN